MSHNTYTRFRHIASTHPLLEIIDKETERLEERHPKIRGLTVHVDKPHRKHQKGNQVRVQLVVSLPKKRIFITKEAEGMGEGENAAIAISNAFDAADNAVNQYLKRKQSSTGMNHSLNSIMLDNFGVSMH